MTNTYRDLLTAANRKLLAALAAACLSFGMVTVAVFLTVDRASGSPRTAAWAVAVFSIGAGVMAPLRGRLIDRRGSLPWLPLLASGYAAALLLLGVLAAALGQLPTWVPLVLSGAAGACAPPLVATVRSLWSRTTAPQVLRRAYTLTSLVADLAAVVAPPAASLLFEAAAWIPLVVTGACAGSAALVVAAVVYRLPPRPAEGGLRTSGLDFRGLSPIASLAAVVGLALGMVEVGVLILTTGWGQQAASGASLGAFALGSVAGGLWYGGRAWRRPAPDRFLAAALIMGLLLAPLGLATSVWSLLPLMAIGGAGFGPVTISLFESLDAVSSTRGVEAMTWVTTAEAVGTAAGAAAAGWVSGVQSWLPFATASAALVLAAAATMAARPRLLRREPVRG